MKKGVGLIDLLLEKSIYPFDPNLISFSITPTGFITAEIPLFADLIIYLPLSIDLKTKLNP